MKMSNIVLVLLMASLIITPLAAQDTTNVVSNIQEVQPQSNLDLMMHYDQKLINTFFWSLAILAALFGLNWFVSFRMYARDKDAIKEELKSFVEKQFSELKTELKNDNKTTIENSVKQAGADLNYKIDDLQRDKLRIQSELAETNYKFAKMENNHIGKLKYLLKILNYSIQFTGEWTISNELEELYSLIEEDRPIIPNQLLDIKKTVAKLPDTYNTQKKKIKKAMLKVKTI